MSLTLRYEDLLSDPVKAMTEVAKLFALDQSLQRIGEIVEAHSFQRLSKGRSQGQEDRSNHSRKRVAGDRKNHFAPEIKETHRELIGDLLIELGCKQDDSWQPPSGVARSCGRCRLEKMIVERVPQQPVGRTSRCSGQGCSRLPGHCRIPAGARRDVTVYARKRITPAVTPSG